MGAPKGNRFWEARSSHGRKPTFSSPDDLWAAACEYFSWVEDNPLIESKAFSYQGVVTIAELPKMRAMTIAGLRLFIGMSETSLREYEDKKDFTRVIKEIKDIIYQQKFTGAAADLLNSNIIARDLGLSDKKDITSSDGSMTPKPTIDMSPQDAANAYKDMMESK